MINFNAAPITTTTNGRGPRFILSGNNLTVGLADVKFKLKEYSWKVDTQTANITGYNNTGQLVVNNVWMYCYVFKQIVYKFVNFVKDATTISGNTPGFGSSSSSDSSGASQSHVFPDPSEISVINLPNSFTDADFENGVKAWTVNGYQIHREPNTNMFTVTGVLTARTKWKPVAGLQRTLTLPDSLTLPVRSS